MVKKIISAPPPPDEPDDQGDVSHGDIIPAPMAQGRWIVPYGTPADQWPTTLPVGVARAVAMLNALNTPDLELPDDGCLSLSVMHLIAHPVERLDEESGELRQYSRLVIIDPEGRTFATTSVVVAHRVAALVDLVRAGMLKLPVRAEIRARKNRARTRTYHELRILAQEVL
jgi:hypothetical protein